MNPNYLDFEQPIAELQAKIEELRLVGDDTAELNISEEISRLEGKSRALTESIFSDLSAWQVSQLARHPQRPYTLDYIEYIFDEFDELRDDIPKLSKKSFGQLLKSKLGDLIAAKALNKTLASEIFKQFTDQILPF